MQYNTLTDDELNIYSRQIVLSEIGYEGQLRLKNAKVCLIGVGGLGSPTALKLTGMGIGSLRIVDRDIVSRSDLHRQYLYDANSVGRPKVEVASEKLNRLNPDVIVQPIPESLNSLNAEDIIRNMDVVIDGLDSPRPRYLINRTCSKWKVPYIFGAAIEMHGQVSTLLPSRTFCLECLMPGLDDDTLPSCGSVGVHPSILGIVSSIQVSEAVRLCTGKAPLLLNKLFDIDLHEYEFRQLNFLADPGCKVCGDNGKNSVDDLPDKYFEETCARDGRRNFIITPKIRLDIDIARLSSVVKDTHHKILSKGPMGVTFSVSNVITACILISGIMIAQTLPRTQENCKRKVLSIYKQLIIKGLGYSSQILPD